MLRLEKVVYICVYKRKKRSILYNLTREKQIRIKIRNLAKKRFVLGYPPRKKEDNSIGDALNWEWIIECSIKSSKDVIIVTRDTDFGTIFNNKSYLNDWLRQEFSERVGRKRRIILTDKLSHAFKLVDIPVTKAMEEEENKLIEFEKITEQKDKFTSDDIVEKMRKIFEKKNN
jgi:hypothetical protein